VKGSAHVRLTIATVPRRPDDGKRDPAVSNLLVATYDDRHRAAEVLVALRSKQQDQLLDVEDAAYVTKDDDGNLKLHQAMILTSVSATGGGPWGGLLSLLLFSPMGGSGAPQASKLSDYGIDEQFAREVASRLRPRTSALFVLVRRAVPDTIVSEIAQYGGQVMHTSLALDAESRLEEASRAASVAFI
jgi:uncharacterized membrane protein